MSHVAHVSIREMLTEDQGRQEIRPDLELAKNHGIGLVRVSGRRVPAAIGLRTTVSLQYEDHGQIVDNWHVTIAPLTPSANQRLFAGHHQKEKGGGASDVPVCDFMESRYDMVSALRRAHEKLSELEPPREGTTVVVTYAISTTLARVISFSSSSTQLPRRNRDLALQRNAREMLRWKNAHWPFGGPIKVFGLKLYPWVSVDEPKVWPVPSVPDGLDPWEPDGHVYSRVGDVVASFFAPIMESLWKAAFAQDGPDGTEGPIAQSLKKQGYDLDALEATRMGHGPLREMMRKYRRAENLTMLCGD